MALSKLEDDIECTVSEIVRKIGGKVHFTFRDRLLVLEDEPFEREARRRGLLFVQIVDVSYDAQTTSVAYNKLAAHDAGRGFMVALRVLVRGYPPDTYVLVDVPADIDGLP